MALVRLETAGAVPAGDNERVQGITDLHVVQGPDGPLLLSVGRGGDFIVAFRITSDGAVRRDQLELDDSLLQLEHTDIAVLGDSVILAGLGDDQLQLMPIGRGNQTLTSLTERTLPDLDARTISQIDTLGDLALVGLQGGGLSVLDLDATPSVRGVAGIPGGAVGGVAMIESGGQTYGFATFWQDNTLVALRISPFGSASVLDSLNTDMVGGALSTPMTVRAAEVGGEVFAITVAAGTGTLSVFRLGDEGLVLTDAILDSRDTRFAQAQHLETLEVDGRLYIATAGSDMGISLFTLLPGGQLHLLDSIAASIDTPLRGITDITMAEVDGQIMLWAATEAAPHLVEFRTTGINAGETVQGSGTLSGTSRDDVLVATGGDTLLSGGNGNDVLQDGQGADTLTGGAGQDDFLLVKDDATDLITDFTPGQDRLDLTAFPGLYDIEDLRVLPYAGGAELRYREEITIVLSAAGTALTRDQILEALISIDRLTVDEAQGQITGSLADDVFVGTDAAEFYDGSAGHDDLRGEGGNDTLLGNNGDDVLSGGFGEDSLYGGAGQDTITGDAGFDTIHGGEGGDFLNGGGQADLLYGGEGNDRILGEDGFDVIYGDAGDDTLLGGDTADRLYGGEGNDVLRGGTNLGSSVDGLFGGEGNDSLYGDGGFDFLDGGEGDDFLDGGLQADNLYGRAGNDTLEGGGGLDRLFGGAGDDLGRGGEGNDGLFGEAGNDTLFGGDGQDRFFGGTGDDQLFGEAGNDTLYGGAGFDTLTGGGGNDDLFGDFNADTFIFEDGHGSDRIGDFEATNDFERIDLSAISAITSYSDLMANHTSQAGSDVIIDTGSGQITLLSVGLSDLDALDFIF
ncbi:calcium-binding protein [Roseovarius sp. LXJ103]|uniref:calcium-binding protein n=1 Tax=Roseovarius carneus TaxID=2853164 RepID=UPI000D6071DF|nr:calcium-binding protein [Roseovarius carneus]MBZ8117991.1 calcium-binding protein [Roseovarius carneus]PWE36260.1 hypothetical protein DD563_10020 [Pelagicola sp. LXJ1103]